MPDAQAPADPQAWLDAVVKHEVTIWNSVPALMDMLVTHAGDGQRIDTLRLVMLSGDWIPVRLPDGVRKVAPAARVVSLGGATEAAIWSIAFPVGDVPPEWTSIPYGKPLRNQRVYVLDAALRSRPFHVPGEIFLAGRGVARGYWNDPDRTAEHFIEHPETGEMLYKTGDMGRLLPDGNVEILGRLDFQVKVQGYRVELGEIEHALLAHPDVASAVVVAAGKRDGARKLVAYVVPSTTEREVQLDQELSAFVSQRLPDYMVPSQYVVLDRLPLNANGKVDRNALPDPKSLVTSRGQSSEPRNDLERDLVASWTRVLDIESIGIGDDFFDAGGQSVTAVSLLADIRAHHGVELPLSALVANPTIEELARVIQERRAVEPELLVPIREGNGALPLICFHPVGGNVACYVGLGKALAPEQPLMAVQAAGLTGEGPMHSSILDMAREYQAAIRRWRGRGPYVLGGWSMGGVIAHQVADLMSRAGEKVALVFTIDSHPPEPNSDADEARLMSWFMRDAGVVGASGAEQLCEELRALPIEERVQGLWRAAQTTDLAPGLERDQFLRLWEVFSANAWALARHRAPVIEAPILVVDASRSAEGNVTGATSWTELSSGEVRRVQVDADHYSIVRAPQVSEVAEHVTRMLAEIKAGFQLESA
jgi:thioesterase domain-containing protein/aryl carrier-like protein